MKAECCCNGFHLVCVERDGWWLRETVGGLTLKKHTTVAALLLLQNEIYPLLCTD